MQSRDFVILVSSDDYEFVLSRKVAEHSQKIKQMLRVADMEKKDFNQPLLVKLDIKGDHLEVICQYLHYKNRWYTWDIAKLPKFEIQGDKALEVLKAAIDLNL